MLRSLKLGLERLSSNTRNTGRSSAPRQRIGGLNCALLVATLTLLPCVASAASAVSATDEEKQAAQKMFEAGDGLYESGRFEDAIVAFKNSHHLVASPNSRLMLARSYREAGKNKEACEEFRGTIQDAEASGGRYPEALQAAQSELKALESSLGLIELDAELRDQISELSVNGKPIAVSAAPIPVVAGSLRIAYKLRDGTSHSTTLDLNRGEQRTVAADGSTLAPTPNTPKPATLTLTTSEVPAAGASGADPLRTAAWISAGVGVVGLSAFGVFAYLDHKTYKDLDSECRNAACPASSMDKVDTGRRHQLFANIGLGVAAVGAATATTLFVLSSGKRSDGARTAIQVSPLGVHIDGKF